MKSVITQVKSVVAAVLCLTALSQAAQASVEKSQRELLVVSNLQKNGDPRLAWLYTFLDVSSVSLAQVGLAGSYRRINVLSGSAATKDAFTDTIASISRRPGLEALDVFVHLHGSPDRLHFQDGSRAASTIQTNLGNGSNNKLRLLYSTACYGRSHAQEFVSGGFKSAIGSRGVNANSSYEYPLMIQQWLIGATIGNFLPLANNEAALFTHDTAAKAAGFPEADSFKVLRGQSTTRISSSAN